MRSATLIAALFSAVAFASPVQIRGTDPDCEETPTSPSLPPAPSPYGSTNSTSGPTSGSGTNSSLICGATGFTNYTVVSGDTLTTIAAKFSSGICDIASVNNITNPNLIILGQPLSIPLNCTTPDNSTCLPPPVPEATETCVPGLPSTYTVVSGDTLSAIAKDFNITLASVIGANPNITNPDLITVGQVINIPVCPSSQCASVGTYTIVSGDLFVDLATKYHTTIGQIKALNPTVDPTKTQAGDQIILPQNCMNVTTAVA